MNRFAAFLTSVWLGMQIMAGYAAVPMMMEHFGRQNSAPVAATLFALCNYLGLAAWTAAYFVLKQGGDRRFGQQGGNIAPRFALLLLALLAANQFLVMPVVAAHKEGGNWLLSLVGGSFGAWHGTSGLIHIACSLLGAGLLLRFVKLDAR
ncbi:MAG: DUF4149 domain-containing protein [Neisseria sp.]|nr:DUF4149 domain-containing protein [Neisseria sp.]